MGHKVAPSCANCVSQFLRELYHDPLFGTFPFHSQVCRQHCKPIPVMKTGFSLCTLSLQGKTCFHDRFFPVKKAYTGKTLFSLQGWVCSEGKSTTRCNNVEFKALKIRYTIMKHYLVDIHWLSEDFSGDRIWKVLQYTIEFWWLLIWILILNIPFFAKKYVLSSKFRDKALGLDIPYLTLATLVDDLGLLLAHSAVDRFWWKKYCKLGKGRTTYRLLRVRLWKKKPLVFCKECTCITQWSGLVDNSARKIL